MKEDKGKSVNKKKKWFNIILFIILFGVLIGLSYSGASKHLKNLEGWIAGFGIWAPLVYILVYITATVAAVPGSALTVFAGSLFGSVKGVIIVSIGSTIGAGLAFLVSRYFLRNRFEKTFEGNEKFQKLSRLTKRNGSIVVAIVRLVPIFPFNLTNYGFGLTRVPFKDYLFWSWLCMLPGTILYVVGGDAVKTAIAERRIPWTLLAVVGITALILTLLAKRIREIIRDRETENERQN